MPARIYFADALFKNSKFGHMAQEGTAFVRAKSGWLFCASFERSLIRVFEELIRQGPPVPDFMTTVADARLLAEVVKGNMRRVEKMLEAGDASVDGDENSSSRPLLLASENGLVRMVKLLISKGADLEVFRLHGARGVDGELSLLVRGARALHFAGFYRQLAVLRVLLRAGANPNAVDSDDATPLLLTCSSPEKRLRAATVRELLEGGADPALQNDVGNLPLHYAAAKGDEEILRLLLEKAPLTVNLVTKAGMSALCVAAEYGHGGAVTCLLAAGATDKTSPCPLTTAATNQQKHIVQLILSEKDWLEAVGGVAKIPTAICAILGKVPNVAARASCEMIQVLLSVEGEKRRMHWARSSFEGLRILCLAASFADLAAVKVFLAAGADETAACSAKGCIPMMRIGSNAPEDTTRDEKKEAAIARALERGPAFRARSWAWRDIAVRPPTDKKRRGVRVRISRPTSNKFFVRMVWR